MLQTSAGTRLSVSTVLMLALLLCPSAAVQAREIPHSFRVAAESAVLMDAGSGQFVYGQRPGARLKPASFVKLLTLFLVFESIDRGQVHLEDKVWISEKAWRTGGSKMFVRQGARVPLMQLVKGIAVVSGNDACVAVAEFLEGSERAFVDRMQAKAQELGCKDSSFQTVNGWPAPDQYTTAVDMAILARAYLEAYPEALQYHSLKEFTHEDIRQPNRNGLLWRDPSVDGLKTGHIEGAGYHLLATAKRGDQRFIAVVMGAANEAVREREALRLLNFGFRNFVSVSLFAEDEVLQTVPVWKGTAGEVGLKAAEPGVVTVRVSQKDAVSWRAEHPVWLLAPIRSGQPLGKAVIVTDQGTLKAVPLVAGRDIRRAGVLKRTAHAIALAVRSHTKAVFLPVVAFGAVAGLFWYWRIRKRRQRRSKRA
jgi:D-alanyl-D-alanine carboxypeptidase (penicillin-binding protein 5/6)